MKINSILRLWERKQKKREHVLTRYMSLVFNIRSQTKIPSKDSYKLIPILHTDAKFFNTSKLNQMATKRTVYSNQM